MPAVFSKPVHMDVTIPSFPDAMWETQVVQYEGFEHTKGYDGVSYTQVKLSEGYVDTLLYCRNSEIIGILNYFPVDIPPYEKKGNVFLVVSPEHKRQGIGTALVLEGLRRGFEIRIDQEFTKEGFSLVTKILSYSGGK